MNYKKIHNCIISKAKKRQKGLHRTDFIGMEAHHIRPRSINGDKKHQGEKVYLTPKEHYVIHQLLVKINKKHPNLIFALHRLAHHPDAAKHKIYYHNWIRIKTIIQVGLNNRIPKKKRDVT